MNGARRTRLIETLHRGLAAGCAVLVFALGLFAASPALHGQLHSDVGAPPNDGCVVAVFATGVSVPPIVVAPLPPPAPQAQALPAAGPEKFWDSPRYLLQPERGPPAA